MTYTTGQKFKDSYPLGLAKWCEKNNTFIVELDKDEQGHRVFEVKEIVKSFEDLRKEKLSQLKEFENSPITFGTGTYAYSRTARANLNDKLNFCSTETVQWSEYQGEPKQFPKIELQDLLNAMIEKDDLVYSLKYQIKSAGSEEELNNISW